MDNTGNSNAVLIGGSQEENDKSLEEEDSGEDDTERGTGLRHSHLSPSYSTLHQYGKRQACTTLTLPLKDTIIVIQTQQSPAGPARPAPFTNPEADARGWSAPRQPPARRAGENERHASLPAPGAPAGRYPAHGRSLRWAPGQKARSPRRGAAVAWRSRGAGTLARTPVPLPNTHPGPRGRPDEIFVATAATER